MSEDRYFEPSDYFFDDDQIGKVSDDEDVSYFDHLNDTVEGR